MVTNIKSLKQSNEKLPWRCSPSAILVCYSIRCAIKSAGSGTWKSPVLLRRASPTYLWIQHGVKINMSGLQKGDISRHCWLIKDLYFLSIRKELEILIPVLVCFIWCIEQFCKDKTDCQKWWMFYCVPVMKITDVILCSILKTVGSSRDSLYQYQFHSRLVLRNLCKG